MKRLSLLVCGLISGLILAGCGGGGSGGSSSSLTASQPVVSTPAPTITASFSKPTANVGTPVALTWSSTNATSCTASGAWSGVQVVSGSLTVTPTVGGQAKYTLTCNGAGGNAVKDVTLITPIPVQASSYLNTKNLNIDSQTLPSHWTGKVLVDFIEIDKTPGRNEGIMAGFAFGDFFQDGSYSLVAFTNADVPNADPENGKIAGHAYFYKKDANDNWVDRTSDILKDQTGCITPRKVIVSDFNGDGKPDVFASCSGIDRVLKPGETRGESPRFLMSQSDGSYKNIAAPVICYCHGAAAAEMNKKGYADIVATDSRPFQKPFMLINDGQGNFSVDKTRFSNELNPATSDGSALPITTVELIDFDNVGKFDVILAGGELAFDFGTFVTLRWDTTIFHNPGSNNFVNATKTLIPVDQEYAGVLDIVYVDGFIYTNRTTSGKTDATSYTATAIQKVNYKTLETTRIYVSSGKFPNGAPNIDWIMPYKDRLVSFNAGFALNIAK